MNNGRYPVVGTDGVSVTTNSSSGRYRTTGTYNFYDVYKSHPSFVMLDPDPHWEKLKIKKMNAVNNPAYQVSVSELTYQ